MTPGWTELTPMPVNNGLMSYAKLTAISLLPSQLDSLSVSGRDQAAVDVQDLTGDVRR